MNPCKMKIKEIVLIGLLALMTMNAGAQDKQQWPVPTNIPGLLFYIQRDPNTNTVCYAVRLNSHGDLDRKNPVDIFWIRYAEDGRRKKLSTVQRQFGYGLSFRVIKADSVLVNAVAFPGRTMHLVKNHHRSYVIKMKINTQTCELKRVYIRITGGSALSPDIEYVEFHGIDPVPKAQRPLSTAS